MRCAAGSNNHIDEAAGFGPQQLAQAAVTASGFALDATEVAVIAKRVAEDNGTATDPSLVSFDWMYFLNHNAADYHTCGCERSGRI